MGVPFFPDNNLEVQIRVNTVRFDLSHIISYAGGSKVWTDYPDPGRVAPINNSNSFQASQCDRIMDKDSVIVFESSLHVIKSLQGVLPEVLRQVSSNTTWNNIRIT